MCYLRFVFVTLFAIILQPVMAQEEKGKSSNSQGATDVDKFLEQQDAQFERFFKQQDERFDDFIQKKQKEFDEFRRKKNEEFAKYLGKPWGVYQMKKGVMPKNEKEVKPIIYNQEQQGHDEGKEIRGEVVPIKNIPPGPQPKPEDPIMDNEEALDYSVFVFYGTPMKVRWGDIKNFKLVNTDEKSIAKAYNELTDTKYNNLMSDCLNLRKTYELCDWAYYQMLKSLSETACGKGTNEAVFLQGFLYQESGYNMRFARSTINKKLHLLVAINGEAFRYNFQLVGGNVYYLFDGCKEQNLKISSFGKKNTKEMRMEIDKLPRLKKTMSVEKRIKAQSYPIIVNSYVNKNLVDFFNDYPTSYCSGNMMTRWAYYANTPISDEIKRLVYPSLKEKIANSTPEKAANILLDWIQPPYDDGKILPQGVQVGFPYLKDEIQWSHDRAFFAEETFYYPGSDCEDHAILFSHLIRDLLGLDVVLVYYPGHLATAICFNENVDGDFIMVKNRKFVVADPTYTGAPVGETMPACQGKETKVILCNR